MIPLLQLALLTFSLAAAQAEVVQGPATPLAPQFAADSTGISLRDHIEVEIKWVEKYLDERLKAMNLAVDKAEATINERLVGMNEFRNQLKDQASTFAPKAEMNKLEERLKLLELNQAVGQGRSTVTSVLWASAISVFIAVVMKLWRQPHTRTRTTD